MKNQRPSDEEGLMINLSYSVMRRKTEHGTIVWVSFGHPKSAQARFVFLLRKEDEKELNRLRGKKRIVAEAEILRTDITLNGLLELRRAIVDWVFRELDKRFLFVPPRKLASDKSPFDRRDYSRLSLFLRARAVFSEHKQGVSKLTALLLANEEMLKENRPDALNPDELFANSATYRSFLRFLKATDTRAT